MFSRSHYLFFSVVSFYMFSVVLRRGYIITRDANKARGVKAKASKPRLKPRSETCKTKTKAKATDPRPRPRPRIYKKTVNCFFCKFRSDL